MCKALSPGTPEAASTRRVSELISLVLVGCTNLALDSRPLSWVAVKEVTIIPKPSYSVQIQNMIAEFKFLNSNPVSALGFWGFLG